jgi:hypothetical protein
MLQSANAPQKLGRRIPIPLSLALHPSIGASAGEDRAKSPNPQAIRRRSRACHAPPWTSSEAGVDALPSPSSVRFPRTLFDRGESPHPKPAVPAVWSARCRDGSCRSAKQPCRGDDGHRHERARTAYSRSVATVTSPRHVKATPQEPIGGEVKVTPRSNRSHVRLFHQPCWPWSIALLAPCA